MKKNISICLLLCMAMMVINGCGNKIPEMDETSEKIVVEYVADVVREHDTKRYSRLMEKDALQAALEEEARLQAVFSKDYSSETIIKEKDPLENENDKTEIKDNSATNTNESAVSLNEMLELSGAEVIYTGFEVAETYPESEEEIYFTMEATKGSKLVVLTFDVTNISKEDKNYDVSSKNLQFKITVDGETKNALTTMLLNDLSNFRGTIPAGETTQLVLVCEIAEDRAESIAEVSLSIRTNGENSSIALK